MVDALEGSNSGATLECDALYDGAVTEPGLQVSSWGLSWRMGDQQTVQGSGTFTIEDPNGKLAPWGYDEPLAVGGSRLRTVFACAGETVPMGEWVITSNAPNETWRVTKAGGQSAIKWIPGGATVPVNGADLTQLLANAKFMSPEAPPPEGGTVFSEIRRLCDGIIGVRFDGVTDKRVPKNMVYEAERINTVADLAHMIGEYRVNGDGLLVVFNPEQPSEPMWQIDPGESGALVTVGRQQDQTNIFNAVVATGQTEAGAELREYVTLDNGPLRFDGPLGRKPMEMDSLSTTRSGVKRDAEKALIDQVESATTTLVVYCTPSPLYEIGDWGAVASPMLDGTEYPLIGLCTEIDFKGGAAGMDTMQLALECKTADVLAVARYIRKAQL